MPQATAAGSNAAPAIGLPAAGLVQVSRTPAMMAMLGALPAGVREAPKYDIAEAWIIRMSVPFSSRWVAKLWRRKCEVTGLRMPAA